MPTAIENLAAIVNTDEFDQIATAMAGQRANWLDNELVFAHVKALAEIMPRLKGIVAGMTPAPLPTPEPEGEAGGEPAGN